eukprot:816143-Pleurochrysis_carterae.AAC.1
MRARTHARARALSRPCARRPRIPDAACAPRRASSRPWKCVHARIELSSTILRLCPPPGCVPLALLRCSPPAPPSAHPPSPSDRTGAGEGGDRRGPPRSCSASTPNSAVLLFMQFIFWPRTPSAPNMPLLRTI